MKKQNVDVVIIFYMHGQAKQYVSGTPVRFDNKVQPVFSCDPFEAMQYEDETHAGLTISRMNNPFNRNYQTEWITVPKERTATFGYVTIGATL